MISSYINNDNIGSFKRYLDDIERYNKDITEVSNIIHNNNRCSPGIIKVYISHCCMYSKQSKITIRPKLVERYIRNANMDDIMWIYDKYLSKNPDYPHLLYVIQTCNIDIIEKVIKYIKDNHVPYDNISIDPKEYHEDLVFLDKYRNTYMLDSKIYDLISTYIDDDSIGYFLCVNENIRCLKHMINKEIRLLMQPIEEDREKTKRYIKNSIYKIRTEMRSSINTTIYTMDNITSMLNYTNSKDILFVILVFSVMCIVLYIGRY